jgi:hypothetical protein
MKLLKALQLRNLIEINKISRPNANENNGTIPGICDGSRHIAGNREQHRSEGIYILVVVFHTPLRQLRVDFVTDLLKEFEKV